MLLAAALLGLAADGTSGGRKKTRNQQLIEQILKEHFTWTYEALQLKKKEDSVITRALRDTIEGPRKPRPEKPPRGPMQRPLKIVAAMP